jgi:hypothetical protein
MYRSILKNEFQVLDLFIAGTSRLSGSAYPVEIDANAFG